MKAPALYRRTDKPFLAIQWTGDNFDSIKSFADGRAHVAAQGADYIRVVGNIGNYLMAKGDWIQEMNATTVQVRSEAFFKNECSSVELVSFPPEEVERLFNEACKKLMGDPRSKGGSLAVEACQSVVAQVLAQLSQS